MPTRSSITLNIPQDNSESIKKPGRIQNLISGVKKRFSRLWTSPSSSKSTHEKHLNTQEKKFNRPPVSEPKDTTYKNDTTSTTRGAVLRREHIEIPAKNKIHPSVAEIQKDYRSSYIKDGIPTEKREAHEDYLSLSIKGVHVTMYPLGKDLAKKYGLRNAYVGSNELLYTYDQGVLRVHNPTFKFWEEASTAENLSMLKETTKKQIRSTGTGGKPLQCITGLEIGNLYELDHIPDSIQKTYPPMVTNRTDAHKKNFYIGEDCNFYYLEESLRGIHLFKVSSKENIYMGSIDQNLSQKKITFS